MFCIPAWQTAGFTTVSSIESLLARRTAEGDKGDNREEASGAVFVSLSRGFTSTMTDAPRNRLRMKVFLRIRSICGPIELTRTC